MKTPEETMEEIKQITEKFWRIAREQMKTPEELAENYACVAANAISEINPLMNAFLAGYAAANRWISVEEELPPEDTCESENTIMVVYFGGIDIGNIEYVSTDPGEYHFSGMLGHYIDKAHKCITHWQPLPPLPTK